ncbi:MAG: hypothetical protein IJS60_03855 [Abditibacteriota bacterium]|nr:hypothetical protein [Abditibacteriota bacterium]
MDANKYCKVKYYPNPKDYEEGKKEYQGCPTIEVTKNGRIFLGWIAGGFDPSIKNYLLLIYSDDFGKT